MEIKYNNHLSLIFSWEEDGQIKWIELKEKTLVTMYKECQIARRLVSQLNFFHEDEDEWKHRLPPYIVETLEEYDRVISGKEEGK